MAVIKKTKPGWEGDRGGGKTMYGYLIHCKYFCKCHNVPHPAKQFLKKEKERKKKKTKSGTSGSHL
jgi:hypothetical protein